jgi:hypothetical protein
MPTGYQGYSNTDWARSIGTTLAEHIKEVEPAWMRNFQMLALLEQNGRVKYNCSGRGFDWPVQYKRHNVEGNTGETPRSFARMNPFKTAYLEYRGYQATDAIYEKEMMENRGPEAVVKVGDNMGERLESSMKQALATEPYIDGNATGNTQLWHGLESFMAATQTVDITTGLARTANAADKVGYPDDTYAGLDTDLGAYGGENESGAYWPDGVAEPEYDFWTPLLVNVTSTSFNGTADTFAAQGDEAMRYAIINSQRNTSIDGQITNCILARNYFNDLLNLFDNKEQIQVTSENGLRALGFKNVVIFDGIEVSWETGVPTSTGYGLNYNCCELRSMYANLLVSEGPFYDEDSQSYKYAIKTLSNFKWKSPRNFFKLKSFA